MRMQLRTLFAMILAAFAALLPGAALAGSEKYDWQTARDDRQAHVVDVLQGRRAQGGRGQWYAVAVSWNDPERPLDTKACERFALRLVQSLLPRH